MHTEPDLKRTDMTKQILILTKAFSFKLLTISYFPHLPFLQVKWLSAHTTKLIVLSMHKLTENVKIWPFKPLIILVYNKPILTSMFKQYRSNGDS